MFNVVKALSRVTIKRRTAVSAQPIRARCSYPASAKRVCLARLWFVLTVLLGLSIHMFGVYSISLVVLSRISPLEFFRRVKTVMLTAFSTSSSETPPFLDSFLICSSA